MHPAEFQLLSAQLAGIIRERNAMSEQNIRLRAENARLREALEEIAKLGPAESPSIYSESETKAYRHGWNLAAEHIGIHARAALAGE
jgi:regulator of replication initiation timing